ncbi:hypothetical protein SDC9_104992 [bioreactor metagenome]|uniref:Lysidine-tRNA(Ile) synthetase C-terminal domain-containing protein n=1 Tax=bioreactor metagenome TaxID=1076179 RepID=A0A645B4T5_9ZZZZ
MFHAFGMTLFLTYGVLKQARLVIFPSFDVDMVLDAAKKTPPTVYCAVPPIYQRTAERAKERGISLRSAKYCISGAMNLPNAVVELCRSSDPSAILHLPGGILVQRVYTEVLFTTEADPLPTFAPVPLSPEEETVIPGAPWRVSCRGVEKAGSFSKISDTFYLKCDMISDALLLRPRQRGDSISLPGRSGKTLKKLFIEAKVPRRIRERIPVLTDGREVLAVAGFGPDRRHLAAEGEPALEVTFISTDK